MHNRLAFFGLVLGFAISATSATKQENPKDYIKIVTQNSPLSAPIQEAQENILALNSTMQGIYEKNLVLFQDNLLKSHPVILALFTSEGGSLTLYRPGKEPLKAPPVPVVYTLVKSVAHSPMATYQLIIPFIHHAKNQLWRAPIQDFLLKNKIALTSLGDLQTSSEIKDTLTKILQENISHIEKWLKNGVPTLEELSIFTKKQKPYLEKCIGYAAQAQVTHWIDVLNDWKKLLGADWEKVYAASNTRYVTRKRNILFTTLAQFMGEDAVNHRLLLFGTTDFQTEPKIMLSELTRVISDRAIGELFFDDVMGMDVELLGKSAFSKLKENAKKLPDGAHVPPLEATGSTTYP